MALPNPSMSFSPFAILTAEEMNDLVENINALQNLSAFENDSIGAKLLDFNSNSNDSNGGVWWEEIGRVSLTASGDSIGITGLPARRYLKIVGFLLATGGTVNAVLRFNGDSTNSYAWSLVSHAAAVSSATSTSSAALYDSTVVNNSSLLLDALIFNPTNTEKVINSTANSSSGPSAGSGVGFRSGVSKWSNTTQQINRIDILNTSGAGDFAVGSQFIILGKN